MWQIGESRDGCTLFHTRCDGRLATCYVTVTGVTVSVTVSSLPGAVATLNVFGFELMFTGLRLLKQ